MKPRDRIVNAHDPDLRWGGKYGKVYLGDKFQVVVSRRTRLPLAIEPIPGNEHDSKSVTDILNQTVWRLGSRPRYVIADGAYGYGETRESLGEAGFTLVAPLPKSINPTGLMSNDEFTYVPDEDRMRCPAGKLSRPGKRNRKLKGKQYHFLPTDCQRCELQETCTTSKWRSVFVSDFAEVIRNAKGLYQTMKDDVKTALRARMQEEQTNYELKHLLGLGTTRYRSRTKRRMQGYAALVVLTIRRLVKLLTEPPKHAPAVVA
ncbi:MAG: transposase [Alicyclobacillus sp.]|nr:transposase [Alicyclobacillus sp.]